jgi:SAM-dependent methyltransferase
VSEALEQSAKEAAYIDALSRPEIVKAYAEWSEFSSGEESCFALIGAGPVSILDIGCGAGRFLYWEKASIRRYVGIDASESMIESAKIAFPERDFRIGDVLGESFPENEFDVVLLLHNVLDMFHPISRRDEMISRVGRCLKPGGIAVVSSHLLHPNMGIPGYFKEDYHGAEVFCYRSRFADFCAELETAGFLVDLAVRDFRGLSADWAYAVARKN